MEWGRPWKSLRPVLEKSQILLHLSISRSDRYSSPYPIAGLDTINYLCQCLPLFHDYPPSIRYFLKTPTKWGAIAALLDGILHYRFSESYNTSEMLRIRWRHRAELNRDLRQKKSCSQWVTWPRSPNHHVIKWPRSWRDVPRLTSHQKSFRANEWSSITHKS